MDFAEAHLRTYELVIRLEPKPMRMVLFGTRYFIL